MHVLLSEYQAIARIFLWWLSFAMSLPAVAMDHHRSTTQEIKQHIIETSIASYPGQCACPYHLAKNGSRCGARSAYSRSGGYSVKCYERDVTGEEILKYKQR